MPATIPPACPGGSAALATEDASPDIILVYAGINDVAHSIDLDKFQRDYREMLDSLKSSTPMHRSGWVPSLWARNVNHTTWIPSL